MEALTYLMLVAEVCRHGIRSHSPARHHVSNESGVLYLSTHWESRRQIHVSLDRTEHCICRLLRKYLHFCVRHVLI
jgi:hypothetical protein